MGWENKCFRSQENLLAVIKEKSRSKETLSWSVRVRELGKTTESYHKKQEVISTKDPLAPCSLLSLPPSSRKTNSRHAGFEMKIWNSHCFVLRANAGNTGGISNFACICFWLKHQRKLTQRSEKLPILSWGVPCEPVTASVLGDHKASFLFRYQNSHPKPPAALH